MPDSMPTRPESVAPSHAASPLGTQPPAADLLAGRYQILEPVAEGGMGVVFRCRDHALNRDLALKVLHERYQDRDDIRRRFLEEAQVTGQLQHPAIVPVHEVGALPDGRPFFAMKLVKGRTLAELLKERADPSQERIRFLTVFLHICQAVAYAHSKGVIHRDLKPANVMVGAFGEVQVMDWGLAKVLGRESFLPEAEVAGSVVESVRTSGDGSGTQAGSVLGTYAYMPPEQARGEVGRLDRRCDVFGLGAVLCEILTGKPPYAGTREEVRTCARLGNLPPALERLDGCGADPELVCLAKACLQPQPDDRPDDASAVERTTAGYLAAVDARLREAERKEAAAAARAEEAERTRRMAEAKAAVERRARRLTLALSVGAVLLVVAGGTVAWMVERQSANAREAGEKAGGLMAQARGKGKEGWETNDLSRLAEALIEAASAADIASAAGDDVRREAAALRQDLQERLARAKKNRTLTAALQDVTNIREARSYQRGEGGEMVALAEPTMDEQFATAFRRWGADIDLEPTEELLAKFTTLPPPVRMEVVAALDGWGFERRLKKLPEADCRRISDLSERLDGDEHRRELRRLQVGGTLQREREERERARVLSAWFGFPDHREGSTLRRLREVAGRIDPVREPVLGILLVSLALIEVGENRDAEGVLAAALAARPGDALLLDALAQVLVQQQPPRLAEAIECLKAARAVRPELGIHLGTTLGEAGRSAEAEAVFRDLLRRQPDNPNILQHLGIALSQQGKLDEAVATFRRAVDLQPDALAYNNLGNALRGQKKLDEAEAALRKAVDLKPDYPKAYVNLGSTLERFQL